MQTETQLWFLSSLPPARPPTPPLSVSLVFARETKLEAINLGQTPLLWLQTLGAESGGKDEQEVAEKKSFISPQDCERLRPRAAATGGQWPALRRQMDSQWKWD